MDDYITTQGDTFDIIAYKVYGDEKQMAVLLEANPAHRATVIFSANVTIKVPAIEVSTTAPLPPWKTAS